jgi:prefoldin beta subunit
MEIDKETQQKIQELQSYEQGFHSLLVQKQAFQMELNETENAFSEISKSKGDVLKVIGNIIVKSDKEKLEKELSHKKDMLSLRLKSIEKQEEELNNEIEKLRKEVLKKIK